MTANQAAESAEMRVLVKNHCSFSSQQLSLLNANLVGSKKVFFFFITSLKAIECSQLAAEPIYLYIPEDIDILSLPAGFEQS